MYFWLGKRTKTEGPLLKVTYIELRVLFDPVWYEGLVVSSALHISTIVLLPPHFQAQLGHSDHSPSPITSDCARLVVI